MTETLLLRIVGRVQGVGYRAWASREANGLGLAGWVRNRSDGSVEALISGTEDAVARFREAARTGPPAARVAEIREAPAAEEAPLPFCQRPTL